MNSDDSALLIRSIQTIGDITTDDTLGLKLYTYAPNISDHLLHPVASCEKNLTILQEYMFSPMPFLFLIYCVEGAVLIQAGNNCEPVEYNVATGHFFALPVSQPFRIRLVILPCSLRFCFIGGDYSVFSDYLSVGKPIHPALRSCSPLTLTELSAIPQHFSAEQALDTHLLLTRILSTYCKTLCNEKDTFSQASGATPGYLDTMHHAILYHSDEPHTLQHFSDRLGISRFQLCREYRSIFGISPMQDLNRVRINNAKKLLINTSLTVQEISSRTGFYDTNNFIRIFKKHTGMTPGKFRKA